VPDPRCGGSRRSTAGSTARRNRLGRSILPTPTTRTPSGTPARRHVSQRQLHWRSEVTWVESQRVDRTGQAARRPRARSRPHGFSRCNPLASDGSLQQHQPVPHPRAGRPVATSSEGSD